MSPVQKRVKSAIKKHLRKSLNKIYFKSLFVFVFRYIATESIIIISYKGKNLGSNLLFAEQKAEANLGKKKKPKAILDYKIKRISHFK